MDKKQKGPVETGLEIAVIGMAGKFPGARNLEEFWNNLKKGVESIPTFSKEELYTCGISADALDNPNYVRAYGILEGKAYFDSSFFGYSPREAETMDPLIRLFHECSWEALEDAGYDPVSYKGTIGMYAGSSDGLGWQIAMKLNSLNDQDRDHALHMTENALLLSTKVSYKLNLLGPSITMFTACSTALVAIHTASRALLTGECNMALAGAGSVMATEKTGYMYEEGMIMSPDGHCRPFDAEAGGTVYGEGIGIVLLKRLKHAIADNDTIKAVIKASAINNDGSGKASFTAPGKKRIADVMRTAFKLSRLDPAEIGYVETHGTATALGDAIEIEAMKEAFKTDKKGYCAIGAVKSNIGHLDVAAGMAGFIKSVQTLNHKTIPPTLHFQAPNRTIDLIDSPFYINSTLTPWQSDEPLKAGVCSFGMGGTNAFLILETPPFSKNPIKPSHPIQTYHLIILSARTTMALEKMSGNLAAYLRKNTDVNLADVAYTLQVGRRDFSRRKMFVCATVEEAIGMLSVPDSENVYTSTFTGKQKKSEAIEELLQAFKDAIINNQKDRGKSILKEIGQAWLNGAIVDWEQLDAAAAGAGDRANPASKRISLPTYPFERQYYWVPAQGLEQWQGGNKSGNNKPVYIMVVGEPGIENKIRQQWQRKGKEILLVRTEDNVEFAKDSETEFRFDPTRDDHYDELFQQMDQWAKAVPSIESAAGIRDETGERINGEPRYENESESSIRGLYQRPALSTEYQAPRDETEKKLARVWRKFFGIKEVGIHDDFFELGGDSLKAITVVTEIHRVLETRVPVTEIFQSPTIKKMADFIKGTARTKYASIDPVEKKEYYPVSSVQKRIYILQQVDPGGTGYNTPLIFDVEGRLDRQSLEKALRVLLKRHESLRTSFQWVEGETVQRIYDEFDAEIEYFQQDTRRLVTTSAKPGIDGNVKDVMPHSFKGETEHFIRKFIRPFDLFQPPLFRVGLIDCCVQKGGTPSYILILDMHHIVTDGSSIGLLVQEFMTLYSGGRGKLPPLRIQYKDYTQWQNSAKQREIMKRQEAFWVNQLSGEIPLLNLPLDFPRPSIQSFIGSTKVFEIHGPEVEKLKQIAEEEDATLFMALLSLFNILLSRISNQDDIIVGSPLAGRTHADLRHVIGMLVNTLVLRNFPSQEKTFREFLQEVKRNTLAAFENQDYLFEDLVEHVGLNVKRDVSRNPIFDVMFGLQNFSSQYEADLDIDLPGINMKVREQDRGVSIFDLSLQGAAIPEGLWFNLEFSTKLFKHETIERFIGYFRRIVAGAAEAPDMKISALEIISEEEREQILNTFNRSMGEEELHGSLFEYFIPTVRKQPDKTALVFIDRYLTYKDLNHRAEKLAAILCRKGLGPHSIAGIMLNRSLELITGILAILKTGAAYLPINPDYPQERKEYMLADSQAVILITAETVSVSLDMSYPSHLSHLSHLSPPLHENGEKQDRKGTEHYTAPIYPPGTRNPQPAANPFDLAYIMYTSGSTGKPKGVMLEQRNVLNLIRFQYRETGIEFDRVLQFATICFDVSFQEIFSTLLAGGMLFLVSGETVKDIPRLFRVIARKWIETLFLPASILKFIFNEPDYAHSFPGCVAHVIAAGEQLVVSEKFRDYLKSHQVYLHNHYGPTETHVVTALTLAPQEEIPVLPPIGKPLVNTLIYIVNRARQMQPVGITGEMLIGGVQVGRGYLNNPELTGDKFCLRRPGTFLKKGSRTSKNFLYDHYPLYISGDLGRWQSNGHIEFLGRIDHQVKIRGHRIEPGEIEAALMNIENIKAAVVVTGSDTSGERYLCAYLVPIPGQTLNFQSIRNSLSETLPDYMLPSYFVLLEEIPFTPNGKINKKLLPEPEFEIAKSRTLPQNMIEMKLLELWARVLNLRQEAIGIDTDFFQMGGHSLKAAVLTARIHKHFNVEVTLGEMFRHSTIRELARFIREADKERFTTINPAEKKEYYPLSSGQKRLFILQQMDLESTVYNMPQAMNLQGTVETVKLDSIFRQLINRHESFRTSFETIAEEPIQRIKELAAVDNNSGIFRDSGDLRMLGIREAKEEVSPAISWHLELMPKDIDSTKRESQPVSKIIKNFIRPFDLSQSPLLRVALAEIEEGNYLLLIDKHHIINDGASVRILTREFMKLFRGDTLPKLRLQYKDYALWQNNERQTWKNKLREEFWLKEFSGEIPALNLPYDHPRPPMQDFSGSNFTFEINKSQTRALNRLAADQGITLFMLLVSLFNILLSKLSGQEDIIIGTPTAGRNHADLEPVIGMFVNTLALRNYPQAHQRLDDFLQEVKKRTLQAFENQEYQFEDLVEHVSVNRDASRSPLFDVMLGVQNLQEQAETETPASHRAGEQVSGIDYDIGVSRFDMTWNAEESSGSIRIAVEYSTRLFEKNTVQRYAQCFKQLITVVTAGTLRGSGDALAVPIADIEIIPEQEKARLLSQFNTLEAVYPQGKILHRLFQSQMEKSPDQIALLEQQSIDGAAPAGNNGITYKELNRLSDSLSRDLNQRGVGTAGNNLVGLMIERSSELIVAMLGILKAGGAYVPLNPKAPVTRNRYILEDCHINLCLTNGSGESRENTARSGFVEIDIKALMKKTISQPAQLSIPMPTRLCYVIYTSGSTGKPKGVAVDHTNLSPLLHWGYSRLRLDTRDRVIHNLAYFFDWSVWEIFITLTSGAALYIVPEEILLNPEVCAGIITKNNITVLHATPTQFSYFLKAGKNLNTLRYLFLGAEALPPGILKETLELTAPHCRVFNMYGPTEATIIASVLEIHRDNWKYLLKMPNVPIGQPVGNTLLLVLDKYWNTCPIGVTGELFIGGGGVARGYLNNPEMTDERFLPVCSGESKFKKAYAPIYKLPNIKEKHAALFAKGTFKGNILYRTGDLVRWLNDGSIEYLGRSDDQVKIRGHRIELGDIREHLLKHPDVKDAVLLVQENSGGDKIICSYPVLHSGANKVTTEELTARMRDFLNRSLPEYMLPAFFIGIEEIPLTPNGKLDKKALPLPSYAGKAVTFSPRSNLEEKLVTFWSELLVIEKDRINRQSNFFSLGGHSLKAVGLVSKIHKELDILLPLAEVFKNPTVKGMIQALNRAVEEKYVPLLPREMKEYYPLSSAQKRLYLLQQINPESTVYNIPQAVPLEGNAENETEVNRLEQIVKQLIERHESFRTSFETVDEEPIQRVHRMAAQERTFLTLWESSHDKALEANFKKFIRPFDLSRAPLVRLGLQPLGQGKYLLLADLHHIIGDGASISILTREFLSLYRGGTLPKLRIRYTDYARWQNNGTLVMQKKRQEDFWLKEFYGEIPVLDLPYDTPRPAVQDFTGSNFNFEIGEEQTARLNRLALDRKVTLFMVLTALFNILLAKLGNQEDIVIGTPTAGRNHADLENIIGMFVNTLALRNFPSGNKSFRYFLQEVGERTLQAFANQDYQFEDLVEKAGVVRDAGRNPFFDVMLVLQNTDSQSIEFPNSNHISNEFDISGGVSRFDMTWNIYEREKRLLVDVEYSTKLFKKETIERFSSYFKHLVSAVAGRKGQELDETVDTPIAGLEILPEKEKQNLLQEFNHADSSIYPLDKSLHGLFTAQVKQTPTRVALAEIYETHETGEALIKNNIFITYEELSRQTGQLTNRLQETGVQPGAVVGIKMERSIALIIAILGVLNSGAAYLPINPKNPPERTDYMLSDCNTNLVLADNNHPGTGQSSVPILDLNPGTPGNGLACSEGPATGNPQPAPNPFNLAYIIYTSGSTGKPKGVAITNTNISPLMQWCYDYLGMTGSDRVIHNLSYYFDWSVMEIFSTLTSGATLYIAPEDILLNPDASIDFILENRITALYITPSQYRYYLAAGRELITLKCLCLGAEALSLELVERSLKSVPFDCRIFNMYGPTEASIVASVQEINRDDISAFKNLSGVPIGKAVGNTFLSVLDRYFSLCPYGVAGELYIGGDGVSMGYVNNPEMTAEKFLIGFPGSKRVNMSYISYISYMTCSTTKCYRTGDLARWLINGHLEFLGRSDQQVKIRGNRIELGEIETHIIKHPAVEDTVVLAAGKENQENFICAYLVLHSDQEDQLDREAIPGLMRDFLSSSIPEYMIPSVFITLEKIPLNPNGKLDRKALPQPEPLASVSGNPPLDEIEMSLAEIWGQLLSIDKEKISRDASFFQLGGHSLKGTVLIGRIHKKFGIRIPFYEIFKNPTIAGLANCIREINAPAERYYSIQPGEKKEFYPLSSAQKRLYVLQQMEPELTVYNIPQLIPLFGNPEIETEVKKLNRIFMQLIRRHGSLRTFFQPVNGEPMQSIIDVVPADKSFMEFRNLESSDSQRSQQKTPVHLPVISSANVSKRLDAPPVTQTIKTFIRPFDLSQAPLVHLALLRVEENKYLLLFDIHHIIGDGISISILTREFMRLYGGEKLPKRRIGYTDYVGWQHSTALLLRLKHQEQYWLNEFSRTVPVLNLPYDRPRPAVQDFTGSTIPFEINEEQTARLNRLAINRGLTLFMVLTALLNILLSKLSGQEDIVLGTPVAGRNHSDLENIIGMFVNTLPLRNFPQGNKTVEAFLQEVGQRTSQAFANQEYQFEDLVEGVGVVRDTGRNPLFDVMLALQNKENSSAETGDFDWETSGLDFSGDVSRFDMTWNMSEREKKLRVKIEYSTRLFNKETILRTIDYFKNLVSTITGQKGKTVDEAVASRIAAIDILTQEEKHVLLKEFNRVDTVYSSDKTLHGLVEAREAQTPEHVALTEIYQTAEQDSRLSKNNIFITYDELGRQSAVVAQNLKKKGAGRIGNNFVGLMMHRSIELIIAMLGILKAGGAYVPLNPKAPETRNRYILEECSIELYLSTVGHEWTESSAPNESVEINGDKVNRVVRADRAVRGLRGQAGIEIHETGKEITETSLYPITHSLAHPCYVIFTSGSTGKPKGVVINHANVTPLLDWSCRILGINRSDRVLNNLAYYFDWSVMEIFITLIRGAALYIAPEEILLNSENSVNFIHENQITTLFITPGQYRYLLHTQRRLNPLKHLFLGGEALTPELLSRSWDKIPEDCRVFNMYGPTEAAVVSSAMEISRKESRQFENLSSVPIGRVAANTAFLVLDRYLYLCPIGVTGELYIGGDGVSMGYINNPEMTAEKFLIGIPGFKRDNMPYMSYMNYSTMKYYRTGDIVRWLFNGHLEFLGRVDFQVKIRGLRIELGEIENQLLKHEKVRDVLVTVTGMGRGDMGHGENENEGTGEEFLCAYIVPESQQPMGTGLLRDYLAAKIPAYMIPSFFILLDKIPLNANGKVDLSALPEPEPGKIHRAATPPRTLMEKKLAAIWAEVLKVPVQKIHIDSNFFALGGHSLKAAQLTAKIETQFRSDLPLPKIFKAPTIRGQAALISSAASDSSVMMNVEKREYYEVSYNQEKLWNFQRKNPESNAYNVFGKMRLVHDADSEGIRKTFYNLMMRHESFRTRLREVDDRPVQVIESRVDVPLEIIDISKTAGENKEAEALKIYENKVCQVFDLTQAPLFRGVLVKLKSQCWDFIFIMHHIISDGWSHELLKKEFQEYYNGYMAGDDIVMPPMQFQFKEFCYWQKQQFIHPATREKVLKYWRRKMEQGFPRLKLPLEPNGNREDRKGITFRTAVPQEIKRPLQQLGKDRQVSLFMILYSAFNLLLARITGQEEIVCRLPAAGRDIPEFQTLMGYLVNSVIVKNRVDNNESFVELLQRVTQNTLEAFQFQWHPLELVLETLGKEMPQLEVSFNMLTMRETEAEMDMDQWDTYYTEDLIDVKLPLTIRITVYHNGIEFLWNAQRSLLKPAVLENIAREYSEILKMISD